MYTQKIIKRKREWSRVGCFLSLILCLVLQVSLSAQPAQITENRRDLGLVLRQLDTVGTFMMITAHPDDENNAVLTFLAKGKGIRTVLLTATRGDGGQNEIGPELFDALAALRTEELLAAHRLDGAEQYFTRAVDFGYSFSQEETFAKWGHREILGDMVRMIRTIRPDVISAMSPDGQFGGQHHQVSGMLAREAYVAAADPLQFPEQIREGLRPWQVSKFYYSDRFRAFFRGDQPAPDDVVTIDVGGYDPLLGRTYAEIGSHARSMHKCQGMSPLLALPGSASAGYYLHDTVLPRTAVVDETDLFDGIPTSLESLTKFAGSSPPNELTIKLSSIASQVKTAILAFERQDLSSVAAVTLNGLQLVRELRRTLLQMNISTDERAEIDFRLLRKQEQFEAAVLLAHDLRIDILADDGVVTPGQTVEILTSIANRGLVDVRIKNLSLQGFKLTETQCGSQWLAAGEVFRCASNVEISHNTALTDIHWDHESDAARYSIDSTVPFGLPFRPSPFQAELDLEFDSQPIRIIRPVEYRHGSDLFTGEKRTVLNVVPRFAVELTPEIAVFPRETKSFEVRVTVTNTGQKSADGNVALELPDGWTSTPSKAVIHFNREDESRVVRFLVVPGDLVRSGEYLISAFTEHQEHRFDLGYKVVEYPHTGRRHLVQSAEGRVTLLDITIKPDLLVGYIEGVGDAVPPAIEQLGARVEFIDNDYLAWGDFNRFNVIVTGVRAYERRADLRAHNDRLLNYVSSGGTVIVQYNKFEFNEAQFGPYPAKVSRNRVTDENAAIHLLIPDHQVFAWPNIVDAATWDDWVQERGLYFLGDKDDNYVDLIEIKDTFEWNPGVKRGALVEAKHGQGQWVYVGLGLWRQLPAGTAGSYELLANLLSLGSSGSE